jgi:ribonuclease HI
MQDEVKIFVHGSCYVSEQLDSDEVVGNGGYGVVIIRNGKRVEEFSNGFSYTTNARMDIMGITEGLRKIINPSNITVYSPNGYVIDTLSKGWLQKWKQTGYKKKKHVDLWIKLDKILTDSSHKIAFRRTGEVRSSPESILADQLGKTMSGKRNLPHDLAPKVTGDNLFTQVDKQTEVLEIADNEPILESICVDASSIQNPGPTEYRGVDTKTGKVIFEMKYEEATNNIGEFLAIVHALALYKKEGKELKIIYSDSQNAISWVRQKSCKTKLEQTESNLKVFEHIQRAINWLKSNEYEAKVLKWNTAAWGQIPADYGRK